MTSTTAGGELTFAAVDREKARLERWARCDWFGLVAPSVLSAEFGGSTPPAVVSAVVDTIFRRRDLGAMRRVVDGVRMLDGDDWQDPYWIDVSGSSQLPRRATALRGCLLRLEHQLALRVWSEASS